MEDNKANSFQNILLDNIDMPINISLLSTPKTLNSNSHLIVYKENTLANGSHVTKIEEYLNQQYDHAALVHLKNQVMKEVSKERENFRREIKRNSTGAYEIISSLTSQIETLQSEVYFLRNELKERNTLIKSLITPYTLTIEQKEHKTKELENKSTIDEKNSINLKQISKGNANTASKNSPVTNSIDFHVTKLASENDTSESKNHVLLPFTYEDEVLQTQTAVSTNNANTNNNTVNDTNSILKPFTTATATNSRIDNESTNSNVVDDSNKLLKPTSTSTTTTNNTNNVNINNSENNTSRKLIRSSIDEVRNESEKCGNAYAAKQDAKEKIPVLNSDQWKKGATLVGDSMLAGLREAKLSRSKRIKVRYFPGGKTEDLQYHLIPYLKKKPDNIIIHIGTNDSPYKTEDLIYKELLNVKETINKFHPNCKNIVISSPIVRTDRNEANNILKRFNTILKQEEKNVIFHSNISASHLHRDGLHLNLNGTIMLAGNLLSSIRTF